MKVIIIDDHPLVRQGLTSILSLDETMEVLGEATNSKEAIHLIRTTHPDLALVDLRLANESGLDLIEEAYQQGLTCKFVILTSSMDEEDFKKARNIGVDGYLLKEILPEELIHALRIIGRGRKYYDPTVLDLLLNANNTGEDNDDEINELTPKEREVLIELGKGYSNSIISQNLYISEFTVKKHVSQILAKLELVDRTQAALYANAKGLVTYMIPH